MSENREVICASCCHNEVCKLKETVLKAQETVDNLMIHFDDGRSANLRDIPWIPDVNLRCDHYKKGQGGTSK